MLKFTLDCPTLYIIIIILASHTMNRENQPLVTDEMVELEKYRIKIQNFRKIIDHVRGNLRDVPQFNKEKHPKNHNM